MSPFNYQNWRAENAAFADIAAFTDARTILKDADHVEEVGIQSVTADFMPLLGVAAWRGRLFTKEEDAPNAPTVVVLSYPSWQSWFGGRDDVIGRSIQVSSRPATIIGVMPQGFYLRNRQAALWVPLRLEPSQDRTSYVRSLYCIARLKSGVSIDGAQTEMAAIAHRLEQANPQFDKNWTK